VRGQSRFREAFIDLTLARGHAQVVASRLQQDGLTLIGCRSHLDENARCAMLPVVWSRRIVEETIGDYMSKWIPDVKRV
jgi:hypothetical protein